MDDAIAAMPPFTRLRCRNPELRKVGGKDSEYYPHMDYDERTPPNRFAARALCTTEGKMCDVWEQCEAFAEALKPDLGVWAGRVYVDGTSV